MKGDKITQAERIHGYLMDYNWHSGLEFVRLSRPILSYTKIIAILRKQGEQIEGKDVGKIHFYRLVKP